MAGPTYNPRGGDIPRPGEQPLFPKSIIKREFGQRTEPLIIDEDLSPICGDRPCRLAHFDAGWCNNKCSLMADASKPDPVLPKPQPPAEGYFRLTL